MTALQRTRFLWWYAGRDLFERAALGTTVVNSSTVAVLLAFILVVYGLAFGFHQLRLSSLRRDPLVLCLWLEPRFGQLVHDADLARTREQLPRRLQAPPGAFACEPFHHFDLNWQLADEDRSAAGQPQCRGRTLSPDDPLLRSCQFRAGGPFTAADEKAVIVTEDMLDILRGRKPARGEARPAAPATLKVRIPLTDQSEPVRVAGVISNPLPLGHLFILPEAFYLDLLSRAEKDADLDTGPVPPAWSAPAAEKAAKQFLDGKKLKRSVRGGRWRLHCLPDPDPGRKLTNVEWADELKALTRVVQAALPDQPPDAAARAAFVKESRLVHPEKVNPLPEGYPYAALYLRDLDDARPVADALAGRNDARGTADREKEDPLPLKLVDEDIVARFEGIQRSSALLLTLLTGIVVIVSVQTVWNMVVIQQLRSQQKVAEIGMLKAMGMGKALMRQVYLTEAFILWGLGAAVGLGVVEVVGRLVPPWLAQDPELRGLELHLPWWPYRLTFLGLSLLLCLATTLVATGRARGAPPAFSLSRD